MLPSALPAFMTNVYWLSGMALLAGIFGLIFGSKWISRSITFIAKAAGVPVFVIALFLVACLEFDYPQIDMFIVSEDAHGDVSVFR